MRRLLMIASREYFAYAKTVGFWLSMLVLPGFMVLGGFLPAYMKDAAPTRQVAIVDLTGQDTATATRAHCQMECTNVHPRRNDQGDWNASKRLSA